MLVEREGLTGVLIDSDGGRLSIVTRPMSLAVTVWPQIAMQIFGTPFPILGEGEGAAGRR